MQCSQPSQDAKKGAERCGPFCDSAFSTLSVSCTPFIHVRHLRQGGGNFIYIAQVPQAAHQRSKARPTHRPHGVRVRRDFSIRVTWLRARFLPYFGPLVNPIEGFRRFCPTSKGEEGRAGVDDMAKGVRPNIRGASLLWRSSLPVAT